MVTKSRLSLLSVEKELSIFLYNSFFFLHSIRTQPRLSAAHEFCGNSDRAETKQTKKEKMGKNG